jgi:hypothetical protein
MAAPPRRKFVIKPFKATSKAKDEVWAAERVEFLQGAIQQVFNQNISNLSFEELYRCVRGGVGGAGRGGEGGAGEGSLRAPVRGPQRG